MSTVVEGNLSKVDEGEEVPWDGGTLVVLAGCDTSTGYWCCVTHGATFSNNMAKDSHIGDPGQHTLAWVCALHGMETP